MPLEELLAALRSRVRHEGGYIFLNSVEVDTLLNATQVEGLYRLNTPMPCGTFGVHIGVLWGSYLIMTGNVREGHFVYLRDFWLNQRELVVEEEDDGAVFVDGRQVFGPIALHSTSVDGDAIQQAFGVGPYGGPNTTDEIFARMPHGEDEEPTERSPTEKKKPGPSLWEHITGDD